MLFGIDCCEHAVHYVVFVDYRQRLIEWRLRDHELAFNTLAQLDRLLAENRHALMNLLLIL